MPKPTDYDKTHLRNLAAIGTRIDRIFKKATEEAAKIGASIKATLPDDRIFSFDDFPETKKQLDRLLQALKDSMEVTIVNGVESAWALSNNKNNALVARIFGDNAKKLPEEQYRRYFSTNGSALDAFLQRQERGLNLSDRVWKYTNLFKSEIELALDLGIRSGESAAIMTRSLRKYLQHPDKLFRRVRDQHGNLRLSKAAQAFHPGRGVYRSSYKNARRLAATETNIAYRTSDYLRWQQMDFVVGIEIKLSNNHTLNGVPFTDICDTLKGRYPKDFKFVGWHPHCRCHAVSVLKTEDEMAEDTQRIMAGQQPKKGSVNAVEDAPAAFKDWVEEHSERIGMGGNLPYFIKDNRKRVDRILGMSDNPNFAVKVKVGDKEYLLRDLIEECRIEPTEAGRVYVHPGHGKNELAENLDFAKWRAEMFGEEIILLPNPHGVKSADSYNITRRVAEEYKKGQTPTFNAFDRLIRDGAKQADYLILQIDCDIKPQILSDALNSRVKRTNIQEIRLRIGDSEAVYSRIDVTKKGFKIKLEDFRNASDLQSRGSIPKGVEPNIISKSDAKLQKFFGLNKKTPQEIAIERHAKRDAAKIQQAWNERRIAGLRQSVADGLLPKESLEGISGLSQEELNARIEFLQKTAKRHAERSQTDIDAIKEAWEKDRQRKANIRIMADKVLDLRTEYPYDVDFSVLEKFIAEGNLTKMQEEAKKVGQAILSIREDEKALADLIPDVRGWHKQFTLSELQSVRANVERTFKVKGWSFDINDSAELDRLRKGLEHEVQWMETKGRKYKTWEVSRSAYQEKLTWAEKRIEMLGQKTAIESEMDILRKSRSKVGKQLVADFDAMFKSDSTDIAMLKAKAADIKAKADQLEKLRAKKAAGATASTTIPFGGMTDAEAKKAFIDFAKKHGISINPADVVADNGFIHLQGDQHRDLYTALMPETKAERTQLWNHAGGGGRHGGRGGYVQTGNSFEINKAFRTNSIMGKLDSSVEDSLRLAGMTPDDLKTIRLLDKKIEEFSMPMPILATRYVDFPALTHIFGQPVKGVTSWTGLSTAELEQWRDTIKSLPTKSISVDPAFLSASTNEKQNVFFDRYQVKLQIEIPPNTPMYLTDNYDESEIVLSRGTRLEYIGTTVTKMKDKWGFREYEHVTIRCRIKR